MSSDRAAHDFFLAGGALYGLLTGFQEYTDEQREAMLQEWRDTVDRHVHTPRPALSVVPSEPKAAGTGGEAPHNPDVVREGP